jgi:hypothetical protein
VTDGVPSTSLLLQALEQISGLERQIGIVQGQNVVIINEQARATEGRKETHDRLRKLEQTANDSAATLTRIAPLVDGHEKTYQRGVGAAWLWRIVWGTIAGAAGALMTLLGIRMGHG